MLNADKNPQRLSPADSAQLNHKIDEDELNFGQIATILRRRFLLIVGITTLVATVAVLKVETDPPLYQGAFNILTKPVTGESKVIASVPQSINNREETSPEFAKEVQTTMTVLRSPRILLPVIEKLQTQYPELIEKLKAQYPEFLVGDVTAKESTYQVYNILSNIKYLKITSQTEQPDIIDVQFIYSDPQLVSVFSKLLTEAYLQYSLENRQSDVDQAISFVNQQRLPLEQRVKLWQNKLRDLRLDNNLIEPTQKAQELSTQITALRQQKIENRVQLEEMVARYEDLQKDLSKESGERAGNSLLSDNPRYQKILDQIQAADIAMKQQSAVLTNDNPIMVSYQQKKAALLPLLAQEEARVQKDLQSRIRDVSARDKSLDEKIKNLNNDIRNLANITRNHDNIQRELQIANDALTQFTAKQQALQIEKAQKQQPWVLLDPQLNTVNQPLVVSNRALLYLALGTALGLLMGIGAALVVDKISNILYSSKELKNATRLPILGTVPLRKELAAATTNNLITGAQQISRTSFFEVFRSVYTNILLLGADTPIRSLVISSVGQGDGKSIVAVQLAQAAAAMGQRVLLVDANLRAPSLHNRVGLMNIQGLTDVISQDLNWKNVIERSPQEENLFMMTAGPIPVDSVRLLASQKMHDLMNDMQGSFDLVIYDTPPILGFADAYLLSANTNGLVLVAGLGKLKRTELEQTLEEIQMSGIPILGIIANKSKDATPTSEHYYQKYYRQNINVKRISQQAETNNNNSSAMSSALSKIRRH